MRGCSGGIPACFSIDRGAPKGVVWDLYIRDADHFAAWIAWMLFLGGDDLVKGGPKGRRPGRSSTLD
jgi:hypothetical protein